MNNMNIMDWVALILLVIGGLNWGLVGLFGWDLLAVIFGAMSTITRIAYVLVGLSALYFIFIVPSLEKKPLLA